MYTRTSISYTIMYNLKLFSEVYPRVKVRVPEQKDFVYPQNDSGTWMILKYIESLNYKGNSFIIWFGLPTMSIVYHCKFSFFGFKNEIINLWEQKRRIRATVHNQFQKTPSLVLNIDQSDPLLQLKVKFSLIRCHFSIASSGKGKNWSRF